MIINIIFFNQQKLQIGEAICGLLWYDTYMDTVSAPAGKEGILGNSNQRRNGPEHAEDLALKSAAAYFKDELIGWLGIREKALRTASAEIVKLETRHMYEDFLYEMENGSYYHFEFESDSISIKDLKRFREYEASTARIYNAPVVTYVICSSGVLNLRDSITEGINTYRVKIIRLKDENADSILERILRKPAENITRADMIPVLFSPLMDGVSMQKDRIAKSIQILKKSEDVFSKEDIRNMEAILYVFATKFLNTEELTSIKEAFSMTKLGQMIWEDAVEQGREEGERIGREAGERIGREAGERIGREAGERIGREAGREEAASRYSRLILLLNAKNRTDLIVKAASDPEYREALYKEYGI